MNYLFINTAEGTRALLCVNGKRFYDENLKNSGSETLMPMIDGLINRASVSVRDIAVFGVCIGPGSFTGLRIGITTVKTLCYALDKPCFAVNNLRLNSYNNKSDKVISVADAGNKVCYLARYDGENEIMPAACVSIDDAKKLIVENPDYAVSTDVKLSDVFLGNAGVGENEMARAAEKYITAVAAQSELVPLYVRKAQPERSAGDL